MLGKTKIEALKHCYFNCHGWLTLHLGSGSTAQQRHSFKHTHTWLWLSQEDVKNVRTQFLHVSLHPNTHFQYLVLQCSLSLSLVTTRLK